MPRYSTMVAIQAGQLRERLVSALRQHGLGEPAVTDLLEEFPGPGRDRGYVFFSPRSLTRESDPDIARIMTLRLCWSVLLVYETETLLEAASIFDVVDGWVAADWLDRRLPDVLALARERYAVLPEVPDPALGLDSLRMERFTQLDTTPKEVLFRIARGDTNAEAAEELRLSQERVGSILRRSLSQLGLVRRIQLASFMARTGLVDLSSIPGSGGPKRW